jgi:hypothetical protein
LYLSDGILSESTKQRAPMFQLYSEFANVIHSMVTCGPDVVNPSNFVDIFMSCDKQFVANE